MTQPNYGRNGKPKQAGTPEENPALASLPDRGGPTPEQEEGIRINGFMQVLEMLRIADPQFRESLLRRLAQRDKRLADNLRKELDL